MAMGESKLGTRSGFMGNDELGHMLMNILKSHGVNVKGGEGGRSGGVFRPKCTHGPCVCHSPGGWEKGIHVLHVNKNSNEFYHVLICIHLVGRPHSKVTWGWGMQIILHTLLDWKPTYV